MSLTGLHPRETGLLAEQEVRDAREANYRTKRGRAHVLHDNASVKLVSRNKLFHPLVLCM